MKRTIDLRRLSSCYAGSGETFQDSARRVEIRDGRLSGLTSTIRGACLDPTCDFLSWPNSVDSGISTLLSSFSEISGANGSKAHGLLHGICEYSMQVDVPPSRTSSEIRRCCASWAERAFLLRRCLYQGHLRPELRTMSKGTLLLRRLYIDGNVVSIQRH